MKAETLKAKIGVDNPAFYGVAVVCILLLAVVGIQALTPTESTLIDTPQQILVQMNDGQVRTFDGTLVETGTVWRVEIEPRVITRVDTLGQVKGSESVPGQVVLLPKSSVQVINYQAR